MKSRLTIKLTGLLLALTLGLTACAERTPGHSDSSGLAAQAETKAQFLVVKSQIIDRVGALLQLGPGGQQLRVTSNNLMDIGQSYTDSKTGQVILAGERDNNQIIIHPTGESEIKYFLKDRNRPGITAIGLADGVMYGTLNEGRDPSGDYYTQFVAQRLSDDQVLYQMRLPIWADQMLIDEGKIYLVGSNFNLKDERAVMFVLNQQTGEIQKHLTTKASKNFKKITRFGNDLYTTGEQRLFRYSGGEDFEPLESLPEEGGAIAGLYSQGDRLYAIAEDAIYAYDASGKLQSESDLLNHQTLFFEDGMLSDWFVQDGDLYVLREAVRMDRSTPEGKQSEIGTQDWIYRYPQMNLKNREKIKIDLGETSLNKLVVFPQKAPVSLPK